MSRRDNLDLTLVVLGSLIALSTAILELPIPLRLPIGILSALVLPGYSCSMAVFPPGELDTVARSALSFSLSLGVIILAAPFLGLIPGGLNPHGIVGALSAVTLSATAVAAWRRRGHPGSGRRSWLVIPDRSQLRWPGGGRLPAALALAGVVVVALLAVASPPRNATEFFVLGPGGTADGLPTRVASGAPTTITVGISNDEDSAQPYRIVVESTSQRLATTPPISVDPGETWTGTVVFDVPTPGNDQEILILLFRGSDSQPYRSLRLKIDAFEPA